MIHSKKEPVEVDDSRVQNAQSINAKVSNLKEISQLMVKCLYFKM